MIAIDGPSGAGKTTAGRELAKHLGYIFIDTGAMYRALALKAVCEGIPLDSENALETLAKSTEIELTEGGQCVLLDGEDVTAAIRTREVSVASSRISIHPRVRRDMVARQRRLGEEGGAILDGRDIGTAVFPDADVKFYLDADPHSRSQRRHRELVAAGVPQELSVIDREIRERDRNDSTRTESPLIRPAAAIVLDTTELSPEQVVEQMLAAVEEKVG